MPDSSPPVPSAQWPRILAAAAVGAFVGLGAIVGAAWQEGFGEVLFYPPLMAILAGCVFFGAALAFASARIFKRHLGIVWTAALGAALTLAPIVGFAGYFLFLDSGFGVGSLFG